MQDIFGELMKIKVCGMKSPRNLEQVCALGPDYVGYIFYPASKRYVGEDPDPALFQIPGPGIHKVGVFVNESPSFVISAFESYHLNMLQLHGDESPDYCRRLLQEGIPLIKSLDALKDKSRLEEYRKLVNYILFDTPGKGYGGTGRKFDWELLKRIPSSIPFLLGGGIGPGDAEAVLDMAHGGLQGVDLNSRFEIEPGIKDVTLLEKFMQLIKKQ